MVELKLKLSIYIQKVWKTMYRERTAEIVFVSILLYYQALFGPFLFRKVVPLFNEIVTSAWVNMNH